LSLAEPSSSASRLLEGRCKKTFEFASERLKTGNSLSEIVHQEHIYIAAQHIIVRRNMTGGE
jgi:hypothetical protein